MTEKAKSEFVMCVVEMKKPFGILFHKRPSKDGVISTIGDLIIMDEKDLRECFEVHYFDITNDIEGTIAERT